MFARKRQGCYKTSKKIEKDISVSNLITGTNTERPALLQASVKGRELFQEMSMNLREWTSNSITLQQNFKVEDKYHGKDMQILGMLWDIYGDQISIPVKDYLLEYFSLVLIQN